MMQHEDLCRYYSLTHHALPYLEKLALLRHSVVTDSSLRNDYERARAYAAISWQCMHDGTYEALARCVKQEACVEALSCESLFHEWTEETMVILVEPHPDDGILSAGMFVAAYVEQVKAGQCVHPLYDCVAVTGANAVSESFVQALSEGDQAVIASEYERVRALQDRVVGVPGTSISKQKILAGGRRVFLEQIHAWASLVGQPALVSCNDVPARMVLSPLLLPCYEKGAEPDSDDRTLFEHAIRSLCEHTGATKIVCVGEPGGCSHGTHAWVVELTREVVRIIAQERGESVQFLDSMCGAWGAGTVESCQKANEVVFFQPLTNEMMRRKIEAFLQHESQVLPMSLGDNPLAFHERMVLSHARVARSVGLDPGRYPFAEGFIMKE